MSVPWQFPVLVTVNVTEMVSPPLDLEIAVVKTRVGKAMAEGIERFGPCLEEPTITNLGALIVPDGDRCPFIEPLHRRPRPPKSLKFRSGELSDVRRKSDR
jgi:hypothetical protein